MNTLLSRSTPAYTRLACDRNRSVLGNSGLQRAYTPFGHVPPGGAALAFNGERPERASGRYILGQGYRAYSPTLMRFERPDDDSPYGKGGINSYAYCGAEPVNNLDPSGHGVIFGMFGLVVGAVIMAWGGIERAGGNESKSNILLGIGGGVMAVSIFGTAVASLHPGRASPLSTSRAVDAAPTGIGSPVSPRPSFVARRNSVVNNPRDISSTRVWSPTDYEEVLNMAIHTPTFRKLVREARSQARSKGKTVRFNSSI